MYVICKNKEPNALRHRGDGTLLLFYDFDSAYLFISERKELLDSWHVRELCSDDWKTGWVRGSIKHEMRAMKSKEKY